MGRDTARFGSLLLALSCLLFWCSTSSAPAVSTGTPETFTIEPGTVRQGDKAQTPVVATIRLRLPAIHYFVCRIRSADPGKVSFNDIVFEKGQQEGTCKGQVNWTGIFLDCTVRVSVFNMDVPDEKLWFTLHLKARNLE